MSHFGTVYSRMGAIKIGVLSRKCIAGTCTLTISKEAESKSIFFYTKATGAGDEIGWDFLRRVQTSKVSFTGFCKEMSTIYQTNNLMAAPFMSPNTFISWFFSWISAFQIDFRKEVDPWCGHSPKTLACDGTHIGVAVQHMKMDNPVTKVDLPHKVVQPLHKRYK